MNKKGQEGTMEGLGIFLSVFIVVIVGIALFTPAAQNVGGITNELTNVNLSVTAAATGASVDIVGQEIFGTPVVINATAGGDNETAADPTDVAFFENVSTSTGLKTITMVTNNASWAGTAVVVTYNYGADGFIDDSGARGVANLIAIFFALAIMGVALIPAVRSKVLQMMGK